MALSIFGNGGCGTGTSCYIQLLKDFNRSQMFPKNLRLTSSPFPANKGGLYDDLKVCHQKVVVGIDSVPGSFQLLMVCWDAQGAPFSVATFLSFVFLHGWELLGYLGSSHSGESGGKDLGKTCIHIYIYIWASIARYLPPPPPHGYGSV